MRWPWAREPNPDDDKNSPPRDIYSLDFWTDPNTYLTPEVIFPASAVVLSTLGFIHFYRSYVRRIPDSSQIYPNFFRRRSLFGKVTSVGDGDNFRLYHTPGGRLLGWEWLRRIPSSPKELRDRTVHIRIAGVDAPEGPHFGNPAQPHSAESLHWLRKYILGKRVRAFIYRRDQYDRVVGSVRVWASFWPRDLGLEMLKAGVAQVYESKMGAEFGNMEVRYRRAEAEARANKKGMWGLKGRFQSPGEYKKSLRDIEFFNSTTAKANTTATKASTASKISVASKTTTSPAKVVVVSKSTIAKSSGTTSRSTPKSTTATTAKITTTKAAATKAATTKAATTKAATTKAATTKAATTKAATTKTATTKAATTKTAATTKAATTKATANFWSLGAKIHGTGARARSTGVSNTSSRSNRTTMKANPRTSSNNSTGTAKGGAGAARRRKP